MSGKANQRLSWRQTVAMTVLVPIWRPSLITVSAQDRQPALAPADSADAAYRQGHDSYEKKNYAETMRWFRSICRGAACRRIPHKR